MRPCRYVLSKGSISSRENRKVICAGQGSRRCTAPCKRISARSKFDCASRRMSAPLVVACTERSPAGSPFSTSLRSSRLPSTRGACGVPLPCR